jgi:hypothetical protein
MDGNDKVTIFSMNKHITPHLLERMDKSTYDYSEMVHSDEEFTHHGLQESNQRSDVSSIEEDKNGYDDETEDDE